VISPDTPTSLTGPEGFAGRAVLVCGTGMAGVSAARALLDLGATVLLSSDGPPPAEGALPPGAVFAGALVTVPADVEVVVASPGLPPSHPLLVDAWARAIPVLGELEFAWRLRGTGAAEWLLVTGTNGKTTVVRMLEAMLREAGLRALAVGNVGTPVIDAVRAESPYDVLAVEASSFQLHFSSTLAPRAGALLNLAEDHLDWHGSMAAYAVDKSKVWAGSVAIANADDPAVTELLGAVAPTADVRTFTLGAPGPGRFGVLDGWLADDSGQRLIPVTEIRPPGAHNVANALAAAALAAAAGVDGPAIAAGLRSFTPEPHRNMFVRTVSGVSYVDDSKATNPHAAAASLGSYQRVVWIAGGQLKGASVDDLVADFADRMAGVVLLGVDRDAIRSALTRHAPNLPVIMVPRTDDGAMHDVVAAAAALATPGDVVLLAPAAASKDMFASYGARGRAFADEVAALAEGRSAT